MTKSIFGFSQKPKHKVAICCIAKNEDHYLIEWVEYHLQIGVTRFYIYDNESTTPIANILSAYVKKGIVKVEHFPGFKMQMKAHKHCLANHGSECEWIAFIDLDEFIVPKTQNGNLGDFLDNYKKFGGLGIHWRVFGSNGHLERPEKSQLESYTKRSLVTEDMNRHIKSVVQPRHIKSVPKDPHHFKYRFGKYCVNENFERIDGPLATHTSNKIQLNHYFVRSLEDFRLKVARGRADSEMQRTVEEFQMVNEFANLVTDENILELKLIFSKQ
jgi:hypothetical protein